MARQFLGERGFDQASAEQFGIGFAPRDGDALLRHLRQKGFTEEETVAAGLVAVGRSAYDRFRGRLLWPIRESSGETIGFGARRIFDGAATSHRNPAAVRSRARPNPVGPAS